jgi:BASS family bile acid:Na+ symporter
MNNIWMILFKVSIVIFLVSSLLDMGIRLNVRDALKGLQNLRFVLYTLFWGFVLCPALAYGIPLIIPLEEHYANGLIMLGLSPCSPFLSQLVDRAKGDLGLTAAFMVVSLVGTVILMPFALPMMIKGLTVSAWTIARPLLIFILLPLAGGMVIRRIWPSAASKMLPYVKKTTGISTIVVLVLLLFLYGKSLIGSAGSFALASQVLYFLILATLPYWFGFGLHYEQKIVLGIGVTSRNVGASFAPCLAIPGMDQRTIVMVVLGVFTMTLFSLLSGKWFGRPASADAGSEPGNLMEF